ncbi:MAG: TRAP transporter substrate-binding protein DctP [Ahrensia sp.]|nr:TRAP transporter substrate-binding protein DctP [Ahrensia sp.]
MALVLAVFSATLICGAGGARANCDPDETVYSLGLPQLSGQSKRDEVVKAFAQAVDAALQGRACLSVKSSSTLYDDDATPALLADAALELAIVPLERLTAYSEQLIVFALPFAFRDRLALQRFLDDPVRVTLFAPLSERGLTSLALIHDGFIQMSASRPLHLPKDLAGLRIRRADAPDLTSRTDLLGGSAVDIADGDIAPALAARQVEAITASISDIASGKIDQVLDGVTLSNHRYSGYVLLASRKWWDRLEEASKAQMQQAAARAADQANEQTFSSEEQAMLDILRRGRPVRLLTAAQRDKWLEVLLPMWERVNGDAAIMSAIRRANAMP